MAHMLKLSCICVASTGFFLCDVFIGFYVMQKQDF